MARLDILRELRNEAAPSVVLLYLPVSGTGLESGVHRLAVCRKEHVSLYPSEIEERIICIFMFFWTEILMKAVDYQKSCEQQLVKPLFSGVAICTIVQICFPTHLTP